MSTPPGPPHGRGLRPGDPELTRDLGATGGPRGRRRAGQEHLDHPPPLTPTGRTAKKFTPMTIEGRCTIEQDLGILSVAGHLGREAVRRFGGAVGWVVARGTGPVILDLTALLSRSAEGRLAITEAARRLAGAGRGLEPAAIPAGGSLVPTGDCPDPRPLRPGRRPRRPCPAPIGPRGGQQAWRTDGRPA